MQRDYKELQEAVEHNEKDQVQVLATFLPCWDFRRWKMGVRRATQAPGQSHIDGMKQCACRQPTERPPGSLSRASPTPGLLLFQNQATALWDWEWQLEGFSLEWILCRGSRKTKGTKSLQVRLHVSLLAQAFGGEKSIITISLTLLVVVLQHESAVLLTSEETEKSATSIQNEFCAFFPLSLLCGEKVTWVVTSQGSGRENSYLGFVIPVSEVIKLEGNDL